MELRDVPCPAGEAIGDVLGSEMPNTPGVLCRVTWDVLSVDGSARTLVRWCCNPCGGTGMRNPETGVTEGFAACPVWQFDQERIWANRKSFGDQAEQQDQDVRTWREDLTGSEYGDVSWWDPIEQAVQENMDAALQSGVVEGHSSADFAAE